MLRAEPARGDTLENAVESELRSRARAAKPLFVTAETMQSLQSRLHPELASWLAEHGLRATELKLLFREVSKRASVRYPEWLLASLVFYLTPKKGQPKAEDRRLAADANRAVSGQHQMGGVLTAG